MSGEAAVLPQPDTTSSAQKLFEDAAYAAGFDPGDKWIGGYVEYEWVHLRPLLGVYDFEPGGMRVLEFGCNVGASSIVLAAMGGEVTGIDVDKQMTEIASANVQRHNMTDRVEIMHVADTSSQPFANESFDLVLANSVLEYVRANELPTILQEIHRVMKPGGRLLLCGTASRLAPREIHSRRWLVNYFPRWTDRIIGRRLQRGLSPLLLAKSLEKRFTIESSGRWLRARLAIHGRLSIPVRIFERLCRGFGVNPGWLAPNIELLLSKNLTDL